MTMADEWGDWIALWALINTLVIPGAVAKVSSLYKIDSITRRKGIECHLLGDCQNEVQATGDVALLDYEAKLLYHSQEPMALQNPNYQSKNTAKDKLQNLKKN